MSSIAAEIAAEGRERLYVVGRRLYGIRRVNSDDLRHTGWAALEGAAAVRQVEEAARKEAEEIRARLAALSPEQAEAAREAARDKVAEWQQGRMLAMLGRPEGEAAFLARCTAYLCAAVAKVGRLLPEVEVAVGEVASGTDLATIAEPIPGTDPPRYSEPIRFVRAEAEEDLDKGVVWVHRLTDDVRVTLGLLAIQAQGVAQELAPFRGATGAARAV